MEIGQHPEGDKWCFLHLLDQLTTSQFSFDSLALNEAAQLVAASHLTMDIFYLNPRIQV